MLCPLAGYHDLPVFFNVVDGKRLRVQLQGRTVVPPVQHLSLLPAYRTFTLEPTPIGETSPPLQLYLLRNGGPGTINYNLDLSHLSQLTTDNYGYEVLKLKSDPAGEIAPYSVSPLNFQFTPLEAKYYVANIPVLLGDGSVEMVTIQGRGYHPVQPDVPQALPGEGERQWATWQGFSTSPTTGLSTRLAIISHDTLSLGTTLPLVSGVEVHTCTVVSHSA